MRDLKNYQLTKLMPTLSIKRVHYFSGLGSKLVLVKERVEKVVVGKRSANFWAHSVFSKMHTVSEKIMLRIRTKLNDKIRISSQMTSLNVWIHVLSLIELFWNVLRHYLEARILMMSRIHKRYRPARLDLNESGIIEKPLKRTSTAISF